jgi:hypothetical protein
MSALNQKGSVWKGQQAPDLSNHPLRANPPLPPCRICKTKGNSLAYARKESGMDHLIRKYSLNLGQLDNRHVRLILVILSLILFILGAGAPGTGSGVGG